MSKDVLKKIFFWIAIMIFSMYPAIPYLSSQVQAETSSESDFEFDSATGTITKYTGTSKEVVIPDTIDGVQVTTIGDGAFVENSLETVTLPDTLTSIGSYAFTYNNLKTVILPDKLTTIGDGAFGENSLETVTLPDTLTSIGNYAFAYNNLKTVILPDKLTTIGKGAFYNNKLTEVSLPHSVTTIGKDAFAKNHSLGMTDTYSVWGKKQLFIGNDASPYQMVQTEGNLNKNFTTQWRIGDTDTVSPKEQGNTLYLTPVKEGMFTLSATVGQTTVKGEIEVIQPSVTVYYVDEDHHTISEEKLEFSLGEQTVTAKVIEGYTLVGAITQKVTLDKQQPKQEIVFNYQPLSMNEEKKLQRAIRDEGNGVFTTVPHYLTESLDVKITSKNLEGVIIVDRVDLPFTDVDNLFSYQEVEDLYNYLIVRGTTASTFSPYQQVTRYQFAAMVARALELNNPQSEAYQFADTKGSEFADYVQALYEVGIIKGYPNGTFGGYNPLTREQAAAMMTRMLHYMGVDVTNDVEVAFADANAISDYAKESVKFLVAHDVLVSGADVKFNPKAPITRAQMAKVLMRTLRLSDWYADVQTGGEEDANELYVMFDAYSLHEQAMLLLTNTNNETEETGSLDVIAAKGEKVADVLKKAGYASIQALCENDRFEGWIEYEVTITTDEDGFDTHEYNRVSDTLYTTEEVLEKTMSDYHVTYVAKWSGLSMDDYDAYYVDADSDTSLEGFTGVFALTANGGKITFKGDFEHEEEGVIIGLQEDENTLNDSFHNVNSPYSIEVTNGDATLTGWTVYEADALDITYEVAEDDREYYWYDTDEGTDVYIVLTNGSVYKENATTEEIYEIAIGQKAYFAIANWE